MTDSTTIEVMLSTQQLSDLAKGHEVDATQHRRLRVFIGTGVAAVLVVLGSVAHLAAKQAPLPRPVPQASKPQPPPPPDEVATPAAAAEPVLFNNPFDRSEVFEFAPGTTQAEAREAVANLLLERAQGRGPDVLKLKIRKIHNSAKTH